MNLFDFELGVFSRGGQTGTPTIGIDFVCNFEALVERVAKQLSHHQNDVLVGMVIIVPQNHVESRLALGAAVGFGRSLDDGLDRECYGSLI